MSLGNARQCTTVHLDAAPGLSVSSVSAVANSKGSDELEELLGSFEHTIDDKQGTLAIRFANAIPVDEILLKIKWHSRFESGALSGFYRIQVDDETYAVTQFQPTSARKAFPCLDQPSQKATFELFLVTPKDLECLSNTIPMAKGPADAAYMLTDQHDFAAWQVTRFKTTVPMSTYLLAWAVGKFSSVSEVVESPLTGSPVTLSVYASAKLGHIESGRAQLALSTLQSALIQCEALFDVAYPLDKLDILVCDTFESSAMENFGLITGRTTALLHDTLKDGMPGKYRVVTTISHEVSHMWFGNMVTMPSFSEVYLNEAFATLMGELVIPQRIEPTWSLNSAFIRFHRSRALSLDALESSHPVHMSTADRSEADIAQTFDAISYEKGASILYMLRALIGDQAFLRGVSAFLKQHRFACASGKDLWKAMSETSGMDVSLFMEAWINKTGFPVVQVTRAEGGVRLMQRRFVANAQKAHATETTWHVPLKIITLAGEAVAKTTLFDLQACLHLSTNTEPCLINAGSTGFFRVQYPPDFLRAFADSVESSRSSIDVNDRLGILQDVVVLAEAGYSSTTDMLDFLQAFKLDDEYLVWTEMAMAFKILLEAWWEDAAVTKGLKAYARTLFAPILDKLGFVGSLEDDADRRLFRLLVVAAAATAELPSALDFVKSSFAHLASGVVSPGIVDLTETIVTNAVRHGGLQEYEVAFAIYNKPPTPQHQLAAIAGLAATQDAALIQRTMGLLLSGEVLEQNLAQLLIGLAANPLSKRTTWQMLKQAWPILVERLGETIALGRLVLVSIQLLSTEADAADVKQFFADKDTRAYVQMLSQGIEMIEARAAWIKRDTANVKGWLAERGFAPAEA